MLLYTRGPHAPHFCIIKVYCTVLHHVMLELHMLTHITHVTHNFSIVAARKREKEAEAGITDVVVFPSLSQDSEERAQLHRDSASTLNQDSSAGAGSVTQSYELQPTETVEEVPSTASLSVTVAEPGASSNMEEGNSQQVCVCVCVCACVRACVCV